jgi:pimeloyl-ACP methyl ester carboxylesterase
MILPLMEPTGAMRAETVQVGGSAARVHLGGRADGDAMVLLHGAWGGAAMHWAPIWDALGARHRLVAPELPGFGHGTIPGPTSIPALAAWVGQLLEALGIDRAWLVGHAFGGAVAWQLARKAPARAQGLVLIDGGPPPSPTRILRAFFKLGVARRFVRHALRSGLFGPRAIERGFADPSRAPAELAALLAQPDPPQLRTLVEAIVQGGVAIRGPAVPVLMVWGESDALPGTDGGTLERLRDAGIEPSFESIPGAGHLPQLEAPAAVVERILAFVAAAGAPPTSAAP